MHKFDKSTLTVFRIELKGALKELGDRHGVTFKFGNIRYADDMFRTTVEARIGNESKDQARALKDWNKYCERFGLSKDDFGNVIEIHGQCCTIIDIKPRNTVYPVIVQRCEDSKKFKIEPRDVLRYNERSKK